MKQDEERYGKLLESKGLRKTKLRLEILSLLDNADTAVSQPILEGRLQDAADRVTLYRALKSFGENNLIHKIIDLNGTAYYALHEIESHANHHDMHVHFNCTVCFKVYCLEDLKLPEIKLQKGFTESSKSLIIYGTCQVCNLAAEKFLAK